MKSDDPDADFAEIPWDRSYIVQELVDLDIWSEEKAWLFPKEKAVKPKRWQMDFRSIVTDAGLIGLLSRFGGIPTNVGAGGGTTYLAILPNNISAKETTEEVNRAVCKIPYRVLEEIQEEVNEAAIAKGHTYLLGPIPTSLAPRFLRESSIKQLEADGKDMWEDTIKLVFWWNQGELDEFVYMSPEEKEIVEKCPLWTGEPAFLASDGLFGFV
jgi:hypothetical protein